MDFVDHMLMGHSAELKRDAEREKFREETAALKQNVDKYDAMQQATDAMIMARPHYSFLERTESRTLQAAGADADTEGVAAVQQDSVGEQLQQSSGNLSKAQRDMIRQERRLIEAEKKAHASRTPWRSPQSSDDYKEERELLESRLELISTQKKLDKEKVDKKDENSLNIIELNAIQAEVDAREEYLHSLPIDHPLRREATELREKATDRLRWAKWKVKIQNMPPGKARDHEKKQYDHKREEAIGQFLFSRSDENCHEDARLVVRIGKRIKHLLNRGKAYKGGSKPTYYFADEEGKQYLYKKSENCCGLHSPKGAIMTELGSYFQTWLDPEHAVAATAVKNDYGEYIASVQEMVDVKKDGFSFEEWQQQDEDKRDPSVMTEPVKKQLLRFHLIDWLLCNFDTKGENLLQRSDGAFVSIDKEGAMSHILDEGAQQMSVTYAPHTDEPIYNIFYRMYRDKKITDLPVDELDGLITQVEQMPNDQYMQLFEPYLQSRYFHIDERREKILKRKTELRESYIKFLNELRPDLKQGDRLKKEAGA